MARYVVGSVPYLNAKPLVKPFEWAGGESPVEVRYAVPSGLPAMLASSAVNAIMVSSIHALTTPGRVAAGLSIGTQDQVESVRLFSRVRPSEIGSLSLDQSSMTSNVLARILLRERHGADPVCRIAPPSLDLMLTACDAAVMIGDNGMGAPSEGLHVLDLGREWRSLTGLPFVWAVWFGGAGLDVGLVGQLQAAFEASRVQWSRVVEDASGETGFTLEQCRHYLSDVMDYRLTPELLEGLREFGRRAAEHDLIEEVVFPEVIGEQVIA